MANGVLTFVKEHPTEVAIGAGGLFILIFLLRRGSGNNQSAAISSYYGAQASLAGQQAQQQAIESQQQAQTQQAQIAATANEYQTLASLNAVKDQYDAAVKIATVQSNNQASVANNYITTSGTTATTLGAQKTSVAQDYINAETSAINSELNAETTMQQNQNAFETSMAPYVKTFNGSQNRLSFLQTLLGYPQAAMATEGSYAAVNNPQYGYGYQVSSILNGAANLLKGLFA